MVCLFDLHTLHRDSNQDSRCDKEAGPDRVRTDFVSQKSKLTAISFGRKTVTFGLGKAEKQFTVHEDLICATSHDFRRKLQGKRKPVLGECSICHEDLDQQAGNVTFCRAQCGQNVHDYCIDEWARSQDGPTKCPVCRHVWREDSHATLALWELIDFKESVIVTYLNWLYTGRIEIDRKIPRDSKEFGLLILQSWLVSNEVEDLSFRHALAANFISENKFERVFWIKAAQYVFHELGFVDDDDDGDIGSYQVDQDEGIDSMECFVIDVFLKNADPCFFRRYADKFPRQFIRALAHASLTRSGPRPTDKEILQKYTNGTYKLEG